MEYYIADARRQLREIERKRLEKEQNRSENWQRSASVAYKLGDAYVKGQNVKASEMMQNDPSLKYSDKYMDGSWWNKIKRPFTKAENRFQTNEPVETAPITGEDLMNDPKYRVRGDNPYAMGNSVENTSVDHSAISSRSYGDVPSQYGDIYDNSQWEATQQGVNKISNINKTIYDKNTNLIADATEKKTYDLIKPMLENQKDQFLREGGDIYYKGMLDNPHLRNQSAVDDAWALGQGDIGIDVDNTGLISSSEMGAMDKMQGVGGALGKVVQGAGVAKSAYDLYKNQDGEFDANDAMGVAEVGLGVAGMLGMVNPALGLGLAGGKIAYDWWENR